MNNQPLFCDGNLSDSLRSQLAKINSEIEGFSSDYLMKVSLDDLTDHLADKFRVEPIFLVKDEIHIGENGDTTVDMSRDFRYTPHATHVPATFVQFVILFHGDPILFRLRPSTYNLSPPRGQITGQKLQLRYTSIEHDSKEIRSRFDADLKGIEQFLGWGREEVEHYNQNLKDQILQRLNRRKDKFLKDKGLIEALGFPIKPRNNASQTYPAPVSRKKLPIQKPIVTSESFKPEPRLELEHYEHILNVIFALVQVMERSPKAFVKMAEEDLRTHILVQLNGHYEGQATGETFNYEGKTDILIRSEGRNIFIGECKFWKGAENFKATIDQLLGYAAWRDTKAAIILFNRNKDTSAVVAQIPNLVKQHGNFKRQITDYQHESGFRFILHNRDDRNREIMLTVFVFDVPTQ